MTQRAARYGKIVKAAIRIDDEIHTGYSHANILNELTVKGIPREKLSRLDHNWDQGFVTDSGKFLSRTQALSYGQYIGQIDTIIGSVLTSEDLWDIDGRSL